MSKHMYAITFICDQINLSLNELNQNCLVGTKRVLLRVILFGQCPPYQITIRFTALSTLVTPLAGSFT